MKGVLRIALVTLLAAGALAACGDDGTDVRDANGASSAGGSSAGGSSAAEIECVPVGDASDATTTVEVTLTEYAIEAAPSTVEAGTVHFVLHNDGADAHEMVVVKGDDPAALPTDDDGGVDEEKMDDGDIIGEVEPFPAGDDCDGTFILEAGSYVLLCNITHAEEGSHFAQEMHTTFTVT